MLERSGRVDRDVAALVGGEGVGDVVDDDVDSLGVVVDGGDVVEIGGDGAERDRGAGRDVVHDLDHHGAFLSAIESAGAERPCLDELGRLGGVLCLLQSHHAVGDHRHANARTVDVESVSCCACVEGFVALGERVACGECAVLRALGREYTVDLSEGIDSI